MCTRVNRDLLNSVLTSTGILPEFVSVVDMNYDPFFDLLATPTIFDERTLRALMSELFAYSAAPAG
jgi:hypothetical protein